MPRKHRILLAIATGLSSTALTYLLLRVRGYLASDFQWPLRAAQALLAGQNPYQAVQPTGPYPFDAPFYYPLPAALVAVPFVPLDPYVAGAIFFGLSSAALAWAVAARRPQAWPLFFSASFFAAASVAQWSPLMMAMALVPALQALALCKPNVALAALAYRPSRRGLLALGIVAGASLLILPTWPVWWVGTVLFRHQGRYLPPALAPLGFLLALALLRWRRPASRLLLVMAAVPQLLWFYDPLLLWLIPQTERQARTLSLLSWLAYVGWCVLTLHSDMSRAVSQAAPLVILLLYLPALGFLLWDRSRLPVTRNDQDLRLDPSVAPDGDLGL